MVTFSLGTDTVARKQGNKDGAVLKFGLRFEV